MTDIAVIGAGASGLTAAVFAARLGAGVTVFEKNDRIGRKLMATGNGRCNLTNTNISLDRYHGSDRDFCKFGLESFGSEDAIRFFEEMGLLTRVEDEGKVFTYCGRASAVIDVFRMEAEKLGIDIRSGFDVKEIIRRKSAFEIVSWNGGHEFAQKVIFAAGGKSAGDLGGGSSGYDILKKLGHTTTELYPSIVQLRTDTEAIKGLKGIKTLAKVTMGEKHCEGELLFTDYGVSGPPIFSLSSYYNEVASDKLIIDFFPDIDEKRLYMLLKEKSENILRPENLFTGIAHKNIGSAIMKMAGVSPAAVLSPSDIKAVCGAAKAFCLKLTGTQSWNNAQVTKGGICTNEINNETMESKKCPGIYITGEILDVDGDCGGFNLQWAWSSGYLAAAAAASKLYIQE